jgi:hypothetical protein
VDEVGVIHALLAILMGPSFMDTIEFLLWMLVQYSNDACNSSFVLSVQGNGGGGNGGSPSSAIVLTRSFFFF